MLARRLVPSVVVLLALAAALVGAGLLALRPTARALPPAGTDFLNVSGEVSIVSRLGSETISLSGMAAIQRSDPRTEGGVEVVDTEIVLLDLAGESITGPVTVTESATLTSSGEIRSLQPPPDQFPASSFFDVFVEVEVVASGFRSPPSVHNEEPLHLVPVSGGSEVSLDGWPPVGVTYQATTPPPSTATVTPTGTLVPTATLTPTEPEFCVPLLPELPAEFCVTSVVITMGESKPTPTPCPLEVCTPTPTATPTLTPCPPEDCPPTPTVTPTLTPCPPEVCTPTPTPTVTPSLTPTPTLTPCPPEVCTPTPSPTPLPGTVSGNDDFADAWIIPSLPFFGRQSTLEATTELGEPLNPDGCITVPPEVMGHTVWYQFTAPESGTVSANTSGSSFDTVLVAYAGDAVDALTPLACNDDDFPVLQSQVSFPVTAGITYHLQVGGFSVYAGDLTLNVSLAPGPVGPIGDVSCDGDVNSIDAALILQLQAGLLSVLSCGQNGDANEDGAVNSIDAALILQLDAGIIDSLGPQASNPT